MTIARAAELLAAVRTGLAFTGAGVSAESGIPTFRGEGGLWTHYNPVKVASIIYFLADPSTYWKVSTDRGRLALAARPNVAHLALAALEKRGHLAGVVTQNTGVRWTVSKADSRAVRRADAVRGRAGGLRPCARGRCSAGRRIVSGRLPCGGHNPGDGTLRRAHDRDQRRGDTIRRARRGGDPRQGGPGVPEILELIHE